MSYLTLTENLKLQLSPGLVASYDIQPGNGVGLFWDKHTYVYSLTYLPRTHTGPSFKNSSIIHNYQHFQSLHCSVLNFFIFFSQLV